MANIVKEVVVSLSRNIVDYPFTNRMDKEQKEELAKKVAAVVEKLDKKFVKYDLVNLEREDILSLLENFYISQSYADNLVGRIVFMSEDEEIAIITNGDDHIKVIVKTPSLTLEDAYRKASDIDDQLAQMLTYSFNKEYGYLTPNIAMLGTAMKTSVVLFLGSLTKNRTVSRIASNLSKLGISLRALYSDGISSYGDIYSLSNSVTMGISEESAIENLKNIAEQLVSQEENASAEYVKKIENVDKIYRSLGILQNARIMSYKEALELLSNVRLGAQSNTLSIDVNKIDKLIHDIQPINVLKTYKEEAYDHMDEKRADIIREILE